VRRSIRMEAFVGHVTICRLGFNRLCCHPRHGPHKPLHQITVTPAVTASILRFIYDYVHFRAERLPDEARSCAARSLWNVG
jgi:hypothetical protein